MKGIFIKTTKEILYSRHVHDFRSSEDSLVSVDGGFDYLRIVGDESNFIIVDIDEKILLEQILNYDYLYKNKSAGEFKEGYHGKYKITKHSNLNFFKKLIKNFNEIEAYL